MPRRILGLTSVVLATSLCTCRSRSRSDAPATSAIQVQAVEAYPSLTFSNPVLLTAPGDGSGRVCVVEQRGRILIFENSSSASSAGVFLDISARVNFGGEMGLLGLAFDPDYDLNGYFYVMYIAAGPRRSVLARYQVSTADPDVADASSELILLQVAQPYANHNAGMIAFGPDGHLYVALGDGGSAGDPGNNAQNRTTLLGSILRIEPRDDGTYTVPADNPFVGEGGGVREEIWAYGLRNPWRFSFDRETGVLWLGDVGQGSREEVNVIGPGDNLGWRYYEGIQGFNNPANLPASDFVAPIIDYPHALGEAVIGGQVYRGRKLPFLVGSYIYGDYSSGRVWALRHESFAMTANDEIANVPALSSFGEDEAGELYAVSLAGKIYRFQQAAVVSTALPDLLSETGLFDDTAGLVPAPDMLEYDLNVTHWIDGARLRRWIVLPASTRIGFDASSPWLFPVGTTLVKHFEIELVEGDPASSLRLETRVLTLRDSGWGADTYRWNDSQTDAERLHGSTTVDLAIEGSGGPRNQTWFFPGRTDCSRCHTAAAGFVLGLDTLQLNRDFDYVSSTENQLAHWNANGLFDVDIGLPGDYDALPALDDAGVALQTRARAYLEVNCAHCHREDGPAPGRMNLAFEVPLADMNIVDLRPLQGDLGLPDAYIVKTGVKESSVLRERLLRLDEHRMPPLATRVVDEQGADLIGQWIDGL